RFSGRHVGRIVEVCLDRRLRDAADVNGVAHQRLLLALVDAVVALEELGRERASDSVARVRLEAGRKRSSRRFRSLDRILLKDARLGYILEEIDPLEQLAVVRVDDVDGILHQLWCWRHAYRPDQARTANR